MVVDLPGPVGADEPGHPARLDGEGHAVEGQGRPEPLAQPGHFDGRFAHVVSVLRRRGRVSERLYDLAGVNPVSAADTGLTPGACHR